MIEGIGVGSAASLWDRLGRIPDRRGRKGRQYGLPAVMVLALAAMLAGANDLRAIFRWGRRLPPEALFLLGLDRAPCHAMYHYFFKALDVAATEAVLGDWVRGSAAPSGTWRSTANACAARRRRGTTAAKACIWWLLSPAPFVA